VELMAMRAIILLAVFVAGCAGLPTEEQAREEEMLIVASALTKVAAAAEASVRYGNPPENLSDEEFLGFATAHDPGLLEPFSRYRLKALRKDRHVVILLCDADGVTALIEDAGCTGVSDRHHWKIVPSATCSFTLEPSALCAAR
jgi:hypothetical protein